MTNRARYVLVFCCAVSAGIHAALTPDHFGERVAAGIGFAASAVVLAALAVALARRPSPLLVDAAIVVLVGLIGAYVLAVTTGVPVLSPESEPVETLAVVTKVIEVIGITAGLVLRIAAVRPLRSIPVIPVALVIAISALVTVPVAPAHHGDHADHEHPGEHEHHHE